MLPIWFGFMAAGSIAIAQQASLQGLVTDQVSGLPLQGANVVLQSLDDDEGFLGGGADSDGFYRVGSIRSGYLGHFESVMWAIPPMRIR